VSQLRPADGLEVHLVDDGLVVHDVEAGRVHHLNLTSALVFDLCDGARGVDAIAAEVAAAFGLPEAPVDDTRRCLDLLAAEGVLVAGPADQRHQSGDDS
jgi:hypothetical protein